MSWSPIILECSISIGSHTQQRLNVVYMTSLDCIKKRGPASCVLFDIHDTAMLDQV